MTGSSSGTPAPGARPTLGLEARAPRTSSHQGPCSQTTSSFPSQAGTVYEQCDRRRGRERPTAPPAKAGQRGGARTRSGDLGADAAVGEVAEEGLAAVDVGGAAPA